MVEHLLNEQRLCIQITDLKQHWNLCCEKLAGLRNDHILEIRTEEKLRLKQRVAETEKECQRLERQLQDLEGQLSGSGKDDSDQPQHVPLHHLPRASYFTDRERDLTQILNDLQPGCTVTLCGPGGIGKTALAAEVVWQLAPANEPPERFPDGIVFHSFYNQPASDLALEAIARAFGEEPKPTPATAAQRALAGKRVLLVLDGTEDADNLPKVQNVAGGCGLLITSRDIRDAVGERQDLHPLAMDDALQLLTDWAGKAIDDHKAARRICELVGQLPLAIRLVGRYLQQTGDHVSEYLQWLEETPLEALNSDNGQHRLESIPRLLQRSLEQVDKPAKDILALAGQLALAPFSTAIIKKALQFSIGTWKSALRQLIGYGLVLHTSKRYELAHALVHTYARERLDVKAEVFERLTTYYNHLVTEQSALEARGYKRLDAEFNHIMRLLENCVKRKAWRKILELTQATSEYFEHQGYWSERRIAVGWSLEAACKLEDHIEEANCIRALGDVYYAMAEYEPARQHYEQAQTIYAQIGHRQGEAHCIRTLGHVHRMLNEYKPARQHYEQAQTIYAQISHRQGEANCIRVLGHVHFSQSEYKLAHQHYEQAQTIYAQIGHRQGEANCIRALGNVYRMQREYESACQCYKQAQMIYAQIGIRQGEAHCILALGHVHLNLNEYESARQRYEQAQTIYAQIGHRRGEANCIGALGNVHRMQDEYELACRHLKQAQTIYARIGHRLGEANCIQALGNVDRMQGEYKSACRRFEQAQKIYETINGRYRYAWNWAYLGLAYKRLKKTDQAYRCLEKAIVIFEAIDLPHEIETVRPWLNDLETESLQ